MPFPFMLRTGLPFIASGFPNAFMSGLVSGINRGVCAIKRAIGKSKITECVVRSIPIDMIYFVRREYAGFKQPNKPVGQICFPKNTNSDVTVEISASGNHPFPKSSLSNLPEEQPVYGIIFKLLFQDFLSNHKSSNEVPIKIRQAEGLFGFSGATLAALAMLVFITGCCNPKTSIPSTAQDNSKRLIERQDFHRAAQAAPDWVKDALRTITKLETDLANK